MKLVFHLGVLAGKQVLRHRVRSLLTLAGVGAGMFLFTAVETMQESLRIATEEGASDNTLVVYRENRFCPATSRLPEHYEAEIRRLAGVEEVIPVQIVVNHCGASLDVITFRGVPPEGLKSFNPDIEVVDGSYAEWTERGDGALLGEHFAARRGLRPGDQFEAVGVRVFVSGIIRSPSLQDNNVAYVHLPFLQQASRVGLGVVTQFTVRVEDPSLLDSLAREIDELFRSDQAPTDTRPEKAFFAQAAKDMIELISFTRAIGVAAVVAVLALVANALLLVVRGSVKENAILQTIGFSPSAVGAMMVWEGVILGLFGGLAGSLAAAWYFAAKRFTLGNEGLTLALQPTWQVTAGGLLVATLLGLLASLLPAWVASQKPLVHSLRSV